MTRERFDQIGTTAHRLATEIEWADFPTVKISALLEWHNVWAKLLRHPNFQTLLRRELTALLDEAEKQYPHVSENQTVEQQAAGLVQYAMMGVLVHRFPVARPMVNTPLRTKFKSITPPVVHVTSDMHVPNWGN